MCIRDRCQRPQVNITISQIPHSDHCVTSVDIYLCRARLSRFRALLLSDFDRAIITGKASLVPPASSGRKLLSPLCAPRFAYVTADFAARRLNVREGGAERMSVPVLLIIRGARPYSAPLLSTLRDP